MLQWLLLLRLASASAFLTTSAMMIHPPHSSSAQRTLLGSNTTQDSELEKREAAILQCKADAVTKVSQYEKSLKALQTERYMSNLVNTPVADSFSEMAVRSAVKALVWRVAAGSVTFMITLKISGSIHQAFEVVGADFVSKSLTMFLGERLMNKSQAGRTQGADNARRSLAKALIWRLFAICNTLTMATFIAKDLSVASKIASTDAVFKTALMFFYERMWARINWGKE
jgi:uncharacterized membrane protein